MFTIFLVQVSIGNKEVENEIKEEKELIIPVLIIKWNIFPFSIIFYMMSPVFILEWCYASVMVTRDRRNYNDNRLPSNIKITQVVYVNSCWHFPSISLFHILKLRLCQFLNPTLIICRFVHPHCLSSFNFKLPLTTHFFINFWTHSIC